MTDKASKRPKRPHDPNELAKRIADLATGAADDKDVGGKDPAAVSLGRRGGLKGGPARAESLTPKERQEIARRAALKRWESRPRKQKQDD